LTEVQSLGYNFIILSPKVFEESFGGNQPISVTETAAGFPERTDDSVADFLKATHPELARRLHFVVTGSSGFSVLAGY
jgi:hypothetical protein